MKKMLLSIFGGLLLTSSISLTTGSNIDVAVRLKEKEEMQKQALLASWYSINKQSELTEAKIKEVQIASQNWNGELIDNLLNQALQYHDNQISIDESKLDSNKLPLVILENINLALFNLNNVVALGYIKVNITDNNTVQLIYPNNNIDDDIVYFDNLNDIDNKFLSSSSYIWYSTYGPSRWWKFWEWGAYIHFSKTAVQNAKWVNVVVTIVNFYYLFKNIKQVVNIVNDLKVAWNAGNVIKTNDLLKNLAKALGGINLALLGDIVDILVIFTAVIAFILALTSTPGVGPLILAFIEMIAGIIGSVISQMLKIDRGKGVKWQWPNFVIPGKILAE